ncbi:M24 family metallopeptidase [Candidatus Bathyarchaeota archaeon]|nr:M24 family metallopeptidase [Candidatus Bathyarchaeota archaeon]
MVRHAELVELILPDFGCPSFEPKIPAEVYLDRLERLRKKSKSYTHILVYGDREHSANIQYLSGYDPRFEEALLIVDIHEDQQWIMVGNEGNGYLEACPIKEQLTPVLYQPFSLLAQPRDRSRPLKQILQDTGITANSVIGVAGWKYYTPQESPDSHHWIEAPSYLVDNLRALTSDVTNATHLLMHQTDGLRAVNEPEQLAVMEYASALTSQAVRDIIFNVKPGMTEHQAFQYARLNGYPQSVHPMLSTGERAWIGLPSPTDKKIQRGEAFTTAIGLQGALTCRAGWLLENETQLPKKIHDYVEKLAAPYFEAAVAWLETLSIGVTGGELYKAVHDRIGDPFYGVTLNPGHLIGMDEWINSPIYNGSQDRIKPGMALQTDIIPATGTLYFTINIEDGVAVADQHIRNTLMEKYPEAWKRITERRDYMTEQLGIRLQPEVLPFSNLASHLPPFILNPGRAFKMTG